MPVPVACKCGAKFNAKDELAGKRVKCPKCSQPLTIPGQQAAARPPKSAAGGAVDSLWDEAGFQQKTGFPCPNCTENVPTDAVICVHCGYNTQTGKQMRTVIEKEDEDANHPAADYQFESHGHDLLDRAERDLFHDKRERKRTDDVIPWWVYFLGLGAVLGFGVLTLVLPRSQAMTINGFICLGISVLISVLCGIWLISIAFYESVTCGLLYLFLPFYALYFIITRWSKCAMPFLLSLSSGVFWGLAQVAFLVAGMSTTPTVYLPPESGQNQVVYSQSARCVLAQSQSFAEWRAPVTDAIIDEC